MNFFTNIRKFLPDYLQAKGIQISKSGFISCLNPAHNDSNPSMKLYRGETLKCFGCGTKADIFDAAHFLEGLPSRKSPNFFEGNVKAVAKKFGINIGSMFSKDRTPAIFSFLIDYSLNVFMPAEAKKKGLPVESYVKNLSPLNKIYLENFDGFYNPPVISLPHADDLKDLLLKEGYKEEELRSAWIHPSLLPGPDYQVYPFWISPGIAVGFSVRHPSGKPKYVHSRNTSVFNKSSFLYNSYLIEDEKLPVWIVEGQKDSWTLINKGIQSVALLGSALTESQLDLLIGLGCSKIILATDNDESGRKCIENSLPFFLKKGLVPQVKVWKNKDADEDANDPEVSDIDFSSSQIVDGIDFFCSHLLEQHEEKNDLLNPIFQILSEVGSSIKRNSFAVLFAKSLEFDERSFLDDLDTFIQERKTLQDSRTISKLEEIIIKAKRDPSRVDEIISSEINSLHLSKAKLTEIKNNQFLKDIHTSLKNPDVVQLRDRDLVFAQGGLECISSLLHESGSGWTEGKLILMNGDPHTGKTLTLLQMIVETLKLNKDAMILHYSTDDSTQLHYQRLLCNFIYNPGFTISDLTTKSSNLEKELVKEKAFSFFDMWINNDRLIMKDLSSCPSLIDFFEVIRFYRDLYPERTILVVNDNFHRNLDYPDMDFGSRVSKLSGLVKQIAGQERCTFICTVEPVKKKKDYISFANMDSIDDIPEPTNDDIAESRALMFHADIILHTVNDYILRGADLKKCVWVHKWKDRIYPQVKLKISKNKVSGTLDYFVFDMYPHSSLIRHTDKSKAYYNASALFNLLKPQDEANSDRKKKK